MQDENVYANCMFDSPPQYKMNEIKTANSKYKSTFNPEGKLVYFSKEEKKGFSRGNLMDDWPVAHYWKKRELIFVLVMLSNILHLRFAHRSLLVCFLHLVPAVWILAQIEPQ